MVILVDTNVILDYLIERDGFFDDARFAVTKVITPSELCKLVENC